MFDPFSALVSTVSNLAGNLFNFFANRETNESNQEINAASLAQQKELTLQGQQWLSNENAIARDWNSPINQKKMYMEAGINPWLAESAKIGSSATAPGAAPSVPAPSQIPMQSPRFDFDSAIQNILAAKSVDASSAANKAEAFSRFVDAIPTLSKYLDDDAVKNLLDTYLPKFSGSSYKGSQEYQLTELTIKKASLDNEVRSIEAIIAKNTGEQRAWQEIRNLEQMVADSAVRNGLYNTLAKLNESNIEVNKQKIDTLISESFRNFKEACYKSELGLTESQMRSLYRADLGLAVANHSMETVSNMATFEEDRGVREFKQSAFGRASKTFGYVSENAMPTQLFDFVLGRASKVLGTSKNLPSFGAPWRQNGYKYRETRPNQYGGKTSKEWIYYPE